MTGSLKSDANTAIVHFYQTLATQMKERQFNFILSDQKQPNFGIDHTIFIPFEPGAKKDEDGYGMYLFLNEMITYSNPTACLVALVTLRLANTKNKRILASLLHELNLKLAIPGWILNDRENLLHFKYLAPMYENSSSETMGIYLTLLAEILRGFSISFPLIKEAIEGKTFELIEQHLKAALAQDSVK
jgi:hypothetical protein